MTEPAATPPTFDWEAEGRRIGQSLDRIGPVVVAGADATLTALVALGIGRAQAPNRRVVVVDLLGDAPPVTSIVGSPEAPGITDHLEYGVSMNRVLSAVPDTEELFVVPTGTDSADVAEVAKHRRWRRLLEDCKEDSGMLVVAAPADAPGLEDLVSATDGVIMVGDSAPSSIAPSFVIGIARAPRERRPGPDPGAPTRVEYTSRIGRGPLAAGIAIVIVLAAVVIWLAVRPLVHGGKPEVARLPTNESPTSRVLRSSVDSARADSLRRDSVAQGSGIPGVPVVTNPEDASRAAQFAVELMAANTQAGAIFKLKVDGKNLPAGTFSPLLIGEARWFKIYAGAFTDREGADSLLARLGRGGLLGPGSRIASVPFTFLIDQPPPGGVKALAAEYLDTRGLPAYGLRQDDGSAWLCVGAFETPESAVTFAEQLRASGIKPVLVYRKGRVF